MHWVGKKKTRLDLTARLYEPHTIVCRVAAYVNNLALSVLMLTQSDIVCMYVVQTKLRQ